MKIIFSKLAFVFAILFFVQVNAQSIKYRLFKDLNVLVKKAKTVQADLLSPNYFEEGMDYYKDAKESLDDNDELENIKANISRSAFFLNKSIDYAKQAKVFFKFALKARNDALKAFADSLAPKLWKKGESKFNDACSDFEDDEKDDAQEEAFEAEKIYRSAELKAIKRIYLDKARNAVAKAEDEKADKYAPITLKKAKSNIYNAEKELEQNRYDNARAKEFAADAYSEARHSLFLTKMFKKMEDEDKSWEELSLYWEKPLRELAEYFNIKPFFDNGPDSLLSEILDNLERLKADFKNCDFVKNKNKALKEEIKKLNAKIGLLEKKTEKYSEFIRKVNEVKKIFSKGGAEVFTKNGNVVIRLRKLHFLPGSAVIQPKYFGLLTKVENAISKFPDAYFVVEGHTDASGKSNKNLIISQRRAEAVYKYLIANSSIPRNRIHAVGLGEAHPIATNKTESGKAKNRRIEIIIKPSRNIFECSTDF